MAYTACKVSKYGVFSSPYFSVFGPEKTRYLDIFHAVITLWNSIIPINLTKIEQSELLLKEILSEIDKKKYDVLKIDVGRSPIIWDFD